MRRLMVSDKILMKRKKLGEIMVNGLYRSDNMRDYSNVGIVLEVGPGLLRTDGTFIPMIVKVGDTIVIPNGGIGRPIQIDEEEFIVCRESEIPCILRDDENIKEEYPDGVDAYITKPMVQDDLTVKREIHKV